MASTYNPRDYVRDYSWIAQAGSQIAAGVGEAAKSLKLFREHKVKTGDLYNGVQKHVYKMPDKAVHDIGTTKAELAKLVPKPEKNEDPRSYTKRISEWYKPITSRLEAIGISKQDLISMIPMGADIGTLGKEAAQESRTQQLSQASQKALGPQFEEQAPSQQLQGALGAQAPAQPEVPPHQTPGGAADREASLQPQGGPMRGGPSMVTQGEAQTRPEAQQRVGQALGVLGASPDEIQKQQRVAGAGLPQQAPGPDDALLRDVEAKGGLGKPLGANTFIVGKTEQLGQAESKAKGIKKLITQITKDPQLMSNPEKRMKFVAEAKPLGLWDDETGPASKEMMAEMLTAAEEHAEAIKGEIKEAEAQKKLAVQGKEKTATPKVSTPMSPAAAEAKLNNEVNKRLRMMFPNDVEEILHPYTKAVTGYRVLPNSEAAKMIATPEKFAAFAQRYFPQLSKSARVRGGLGAPAVNDDPEGLFN